MQQPSPLQSKSSRNLPFRSTTLVFGATALIVYGLSRRSKSGATLAAVAGGLLALKAGQNPAQPEETHAVFLVNATPEQAYGLWRNLAVLPRFMVHLKDVRELDDRRSEWTAFGPGQREIHWTAELTEDIRDQRIAWRSLPNTGVQTSGSVDFRPDPQGRGTFVSAKVQYNVPGGSLSSGLASLFGKNPEFVVREELRHFKQLLESGEVPTTRGQTHGPRGVHGHAEQVLFREKSNLADPQFAPRYKRSA